MENNSSFTIQHSAFAAGVAWRAWGMLNKPVQKETPGPLNRKRSRKGSWGQRRQAVLAKSLSQTFSILFSIDRNEGGIL